MSSQTIPKAVIIPGPLPLMESPPFWSIFKRSLSKTESYEQLERALNLFMQVLGKHEADPNLKHVKLVEAKNLLDTVTQAKNAHLAGQGSEKPSALTKIYRAKVQNYQKTTESELLAFENEFKALWSGPATADEEAKAMGSTKANAFIRKLFGSAIFKTLSTERNNSPEETSGAFGNPDLELFHRSLVDEINEDPEARKSLQLEYDLSADYTFNARAHRDNMQPFSFPARSAQEGHGTPPDVPSGSTSTGPSSQGVHHYHDLSEISERTELSAISALSVRLLESGGDSALFHRTQISDANASIISSAYQATEASLFSGSSEMSEDPNWRRTYDGY